ncbi:MAG: aminopeptidase [Oscillospiraceae bacterium]|nr:aminopeptidase [Oscillospiraceae bacterium]
MAGEKSEKQEKSQGEILKEKLFYKTKQGFETLDDEKIKTAFDFCEGYKKFLDNGKTEREAASETVKILEENGFIPYEFGKKYNPGDGVYLNNQGKNILAARIGEKTVDNGINIIAAHIDSPRIDLKQRPLYEDNGLAFFKTHYYGGIKKYQWLTIPLALHGVIVKSDGESVAVKLGENEIDPVFCITDLLPHLAKDQFSKNLADAVAGESLNILLGSRPFRGDKDSKDKDKTEDKVTEKVKLNILNMLNKKYGITESDFISAELSLVPAVKSRDVGFDRSLVGSYGQDDRVCAYPPIIALTETKKTDRTAVVILADKEEIGSEGNTSMQSHIFRHLVESLADMQGVSRFTMFANSNCLSADVNAAFDPNYADVYETRNAAFLNNGVVLTKYTGSRGKSGSSDAHAEFIGYIRKIFDDNNVLWQTSELGKVDQGGGGTVAAYIANLNINVVDLGVGILSMHAPFEVASKVDIYMMYEASKAFIKA